MDDDCEGKEYVVMTDAKECFCKVGRDVDVEVDVIEVEDDDVDVGVIDDVKEVDEDVDVDEDDQVPVVEDVEDAVQDVDVDDLDEEEDAVHDVPANCKVPFRKFEAEEVVVEPPLGDVVVSVDVEGKVPERSKVLDDHVEPLVADVLPFDAPIFCSFFGR